MAGTSSCLPQLFRRKSVKLQSGKNQDSYVKHKAPDNSPNKLSSRSGGSGRNSFSSQRNSFSSQTSRHSDSPSKNDKPRECLSKSSSGGSVRSTLTSQTSKHSDASSKQQEDKTADNLAKSASGGYGSSFLVFMELRKRITTFRDIFDIPPLNGSVPIQELIISTAEDLHRMYPEFVPFDPKIYERNTHQGLICFYEVLKCVGDSAWIDDPKVREKFRHSNVEQVPFEELTETVVTILDCINKAAKERFDNLADEDELKKDYGSQSIPIDKDKLSEPQSPEWKCNGSPPTPTSVLPASPKFGERESQNYSPPHLWDLRVQSPDKLNPVDWKRLSFHMILQNSLHNQANKDAKQSNRPNANVRGSLSLPGRMEEAKDGNDVLISEEPNTKESTAKRPGHMIEQAEGNKEPTAPIESLPNLESADLSGQSHDSQAQTTESTQKAERDNEKVGQSPPPPPTEERVQSEEKTSPQHPPPPPSNVTPSSPQQTLPPPVPPTGEMPPSSTTKPPPPAPIDNATPPNPSNDNSTNTKPPPRPPSNATTPPPPPPPGAAPPPPPPGPNGGPIAPPAPTPSGKGGGPPPPPPASGKTLRRINTKLKRSSQMGNLYRLLKGKVEGSSLAGKSSQPRKASANNAAGGGQSMADALAEMTKRSAYFQQIEEDVEKHANSIKEMQKSLNSFQTKDMDELLQFHQEVESKLEVLTDESQVLSRFEGFPMKKLETLRMATALYTKLNGVLSELQSWKIESPLGQLLEKVERYFTKLKAEMEALERTKDEEAKKFQSHNIHFDFGIFVKIKEAMVDVSSGCMELALKERREAKAATSDQTWSKPGGQKKVCAKMLWRAFQLAFKVYSFAGGQDDRADNLTKELAREIETDPMQD